MSEAERGKIDEAIIGIDPGKSGGIAMIHLTSGLVNAMKMPDTDRDLWDLFDRVLRGSNVFAYIEKVNAMPKQGVSSTFKFGQNYGMLRAFLIAAEIPFEWVTPVVWQRKMKCLSGGDKRVTRARAQELFPEIKITHAVADALLICEYGRRLRAGELQ